MKEIETLMNKGIKKDEFLFRSIVARDVANGFGSLFVSEHKSMEDAIRGVQENIESFGKLEKITHIALFKIKEDGEPWKNK